MKLSWTARGAVVLVVAGTLATGVPLAMDATPAFAQCAPTPNTNATPLSGVPWQLTRLRPETAWPLSRGRNQIVAVIDDGVSSKHPELAGQVLSGTDLLDAGGKGDCDNDGHGTFVASLVAGKDSPDTAFHGIAPDAKILPIRVLNDMASTADTNAPKRVADGIEYAVNHNATVINLSLYTPKSADVEAAVKDALAKGVVVVAAAGNTGRAEQVYPAALPGVIAVAGVDVDGNHVSSSSTGSFISVAAPGDANVAGAARDGTGYLRDDKGGTSFAAALVSGTVALIRARFPTLTPAQVARRLMATADAPPGGRNDEVGAGVVNPYRAVATILANEDTVLPSPKTRLAEPTSRTIDNAHTRTIAIVIAVLGLLAAFVMTVVVPLVRGLARAASAGSPNPSPAGGRAAGRRRAPKRARPSAMVPVGGPPPGQVLVGAGVSASGGMVGAPPAGRTVAGGPSPVGPPPGPAGPRQAGPYPPPPAGNYPPSSGPPYGQPPPPGPAPAPYPPPGGSFPPPPGSPYAPPPPPAAYPPPPAGGPPYPPEAQRGPMPPGPAGPRYPQGTQQGAPIAAQPGLPQAAPPPTPPPPPPKRKRFGRRG